MYLQCEQYQVPTVDLEPAISNISSVVNLHGKKKLSGKGDQLILVNGGSEHT